MTKNLYKSPRVLITSILLGLGTSSANAEKLLEFRFNEKGSFAASSSDSKARLTLSLINAEGDPADLHGSGGSGVSGKSGDLAFDCTSATGMGRAPDNLPPPAPKNYIGPVAVAEDDSTVLCGLKSYTVQGWFKTDGEYLNRLARLVQFNNALDPSKTLLELGSNVNGGTLFLGITTPTETRRENVDTKGIPNAYNMVNQWVFFALTYSKHEFTFYVGDTVNTVARAGVSKGDGATGDVTTVLSIGNTVVPRRPFKGWIDNIRVYGSVDEESGALSINDLEMLRQLDARGL